jgi:PncC family amidohydrolase
MNISEKVGMYLKCNNLHVVTAESCTAGLIASKLAETPGSSSWLEAGFIVYSPHAKNKMLNVSLDTIELFNITSREVAEEMAIGALFRSNADCALSTTGISGPTGGTDEIPLGTICFAWAFRKTLLDSEQICVYSEKKVFTGSRNEIREQAAEYSLNQIELYMNKNKKSNNHVFNR